MINKSEINLNLVPETGETFSFNASEIAKLPRFEDISVNDEENSVKVKVTPIGDIHFQIDASINLKRPMNCSRCGEDFQNWFKNDIQEFLSLETDEEGEDQGFLLVESPKNWSWTDFVVDSVELETPYQTYKYGEKCLVSCPHYDNAVEKGWITREEDKPNPFQALEKLKNKPN
ncbi:MAG: YceD family protein [Bdellovibrionales bacterium]